MARSPARWIGWREPFEPGPALAVAASGGADSMALALLARDWADDRDGNVLAMVVDHRLRPESAAEARLTLDRLRDYGIPSRLLTLTSLHPGTALAERARIARYKTLTQSCADAGIVHLLLGHQAGDQIETLAMRALRGTQTHGLAGMSALRETASVRMLRPLLGIDPACLRDFLTGQGAGWVDDPSNRNRSALRVRLRQGLSKAPVGESGLPAALAEAGRSRVRAEEAAAAELAQRVTIRPEGFAVLSGGRIGADALGALIRAIAGAPYPPSQSHISGLAASPGPATVAGVRILPGGRFCDGLLLIREEASIAPPVPAVDNVIWDRRFRLIARAGIPAGATIGKLGEDASQFRRASDLPSAILRTLPAIRIGEMLASVPHLGYGSRDNDPPMTMLFAPEMAAACLCFVPVA